jgi:transcriptional regulator NrdR family protein
MEVKGVRIENEGGLKAKDILEMANRIYSECKAYFKANGIKYSMLEDGSTPDINKKLDELFELKAKEYHQFYYSYPTVIRHMTQDMAYSPEAFERYLRGLEKAPWTNDAARMDSYTDYAVELYRIKNRNNRLSAKELSAFRRDYRGRLQKEHETFEADKERYKAMVQEENKRFDMEKRDELLAAMKRIAEQNNVDKNKIEAIGALINSGVLKADRLEVMVQEMQELARQERERRENETIRAANGH